MRLLERAAGRVHLSRSSERPRLARGPEQSHRAQRSPPARADDPQSAVERREIHQRGQDPARLPSAWRQAPHRGLGHRRSAFRKGASGDIRGIPSARQSRARAQQRSRSRSRDRAAPGRPAWAHDRCSLPPWQGLGLRRRGAARTRCAELAAAPVRRDDATEQPRHQGGTILVVEDDPSVREMLALAARRRGSTARLLSRTGPGRWNWRRAARSARTSSSPTTICRTVSTACRSSPACERRSVTRSRPSS